MVPRSEYDAVCKDLERMHDALNEQANAPENTRASVDVEALKAEILQEVAKTRNNPLSIDAGSAVFEAIDAIAAKFPELVGGRDGT